MFKLSKINIPNTYLRLNVMVVCEMVLLLLISLVVMLFFSRQALVEGAKLDVEQRQLANEQHKKNMLQSVEQMTVNIYQDVRQHLDQPERMYLYCRKIVETNPDVVGCAIVFKPYYYKDRELMMAYVHRKSDDVTDPKSSELVTQQTFTKRPYTEQKWYTQPMLSGKPCWVQLLKKDKIEDEPLMTYCQPIYDSNNQCVGVIGTDLTVKHEEEIIYKEAGIFHDFNHLTYMVIIITVLGMLVFILLSRVVIRRQMQPLRLLTHSAQRVTEGNYAESVPETQREDEIGQLQNLFHRMQQSLAAKSGELEQMTERLTRRSEELRKALGNAHGSDRMKTTFLHYMTMQMTVPSDLIERSVVKLSNNFDTIGSQEAEFEVGIIKEQSEKILDLLDHMVEALTIEAEESEKALNEGKEVSHD
jgi:nitrogen fixation/metabolism regulation signal transduction histidine kinase